MTPHFSEDGNLLPAWCDIQDNQRRGVEMVRDSTQQLLRAFGKVDYEVRPAKSELKMVTDFGLFLCYKNPVRPQLV
jgi:hypothetical protein